MIIKALLPTFTKTTTIKIPDVSGLTVVEAEKVLTNEGFVVVDETKKEYSDEYAEGIVIGTDPQVDRKRPKGTKITMIESLGKNETYVIENYIGQNYIEVQTKLQSLYKMEVVIEKKDVDLGEKNVEEERQKIVEQSIEPGTEVIISEDNPAKITLYIPDAYENYPDFVAEGWTIEEINEFAEKYSLKVSFKEEESSEYPAGTIIKQSRTGKILKGANITITIAKTPTVEENSEQEENTQA